MNIIAQHGTDKVFSQFDFGFLGQNTADNATDENYAETAKLGVWFNIGGDLGFYPIIMDCELSLSNPFHVESLEALAGALNCQTADELREWLVANDYDGLEVEDEEMGGISYVVFDSKQIKIL